MKKPKVKKLKKKSIGFYKKKLWAIFSQFIRLTYADSDGLTECVTCGDRKHWKDMQAGHFLAGRNNGVLFDVRNVHCQCLGCNVFKHGNLENYWPFMINKYGQGVIDELKKQKRNPPKLDRTFYEEAIVRCEDQVSRIKSEKGL